ncbi:MAG: DUF3341 domain-containing protein [Candidatus Lindowbacteria bacterium]|nr:DUF3341 domain-containing protein [Candidatus Lindowbacteria bacterium]
MKQFRDNRPTTLAVFSSAEELTAAVNVMLRSGHRTMEALSPIPMPELDELLPQRPSTVRWFTFAGCIVGGLFGMALQVLTVLHWPLLVGGKPALSWPAFVVICFEMTILFGAFAALGGFMLNAKLPPIAKEHYHTGCSQSDFALLVRHDASEYASLEAQLRAAGATEVRLLENQRL